MVYSRIAIISAGAKATVVANLTRSSSELHKLIYQTNFCKADLFNFTDAVQLAERIFADDRTRSNVPKVVVLFSSRTITCLPTSRCYILRSAKNYEDTYGCSLVAKMSRTYGVTFIGLSVGNHGLNMDFVRGCSLIPFDGFHSYSRIYRTLCYELIVANALKNFKNSKDFSVNCNCETKSLSQLSFGGSDVCSRRNLCVESRNLRLSFDDAAEHCRSRGFSLAIPTDKHTSSFIEGQITSRNKAEEYWIGLRKHGDKLYYLTSYKVLSEVGSLQTDWCPDANIKNDGCVYRRRCQARSGYGWDVGPCGPLTPLRHFACETTACSTIKYCDDQPGREYCRKGESDALRC
ncbi:unnamed protein product [Enterobius vermicularis]|uniref:C-type lectin domain-containing protein n=1 Tax=Enterobius vermicularis TaxID=51028 RepID=A0A0N4V1E0_ENTVE|nr:unnamed protein product [Enterobius vermicularis]